MGDENPIRTLGDYSKPSHEGYWNTIELPKRNKDLLQKVPHHGIDLWLQVQIFYDHVNPATRQTIDQSACGKFHDRNAKESWALLKDLAIYDNKSWNDPRDFTKPVKAISLPQDILSTSDRRLIELENQVQHLMEAYLTPKQPSQSVIDGYNRWMSHEDYAEPYAIRVNKEVFHQVDESYFAINATDIIELLTDQELKCGILTLFEMSMHHLKGHSSQNKVGFLNPVMITADSCFYEKVIGSLKWEFPLVNYQLGDWECGYYVMKWMNDFVLKYQNENFPNIVPWTNKRPLENKELIAIICGWFTLWLEPKRKPLNPKKIFNFIGRVRGLKVFIGNFTYECDFMVLEDTTSVIDHDLGSVVIFDEKILEVLRKFHMTILRGRFNQLSRGSSPLLTKPGEY
nr:ulp1 protease family, C-terminal catalytic domain-containing protein [Tanacetum cinerariifolium]